MDEKALKKKEIPMLPMLIGTSLGAGFWPWGPGTAGAVMGTAIWLVLYQGLSTGWLLAVMAVLIAVFTWLGTWATSRLMPYWGDDPKRVVIDEVVGVWVALLGASSPWGALVALVLFRFFDIVKPLGVRALDRRKGAFWVMADDLLAGFYAFILTFAVSLFWNPSVM